MALPPHLRTEQSGETGNDENRNGNTRDAARCRIRRLEMLSKNSIRERLGRVAGLVLLAMVGAIAMPARAASSYVPSLVVSSTNAINATGLPGIWATSLWMLAETSIQSMRAAASWSRSHTAAEPHDGSGSEQLRHHVVLDRRRQGQLVCDAGLFGIRHPDSYLRLHAESLRANKYRHRRSWRHQLLLGRLRRGDGFGGRSVYRDKRSLLRILQRTASSSMRRGGTQREPHC